MPLTLPWGNKLYSVADQWTGFRGLENFVKSVQNLCKNAETVNANATFYSMALKTCVVHDDISPRI